MNRHLFVLVSATSALLFLRDAHGQTLAADSPNSDQLQEIVVTAERRESDLQTTPMAVTALSAEMLKSLGVTDVESLASVVPGVSFGDELGEAHIYIRGIGSDAVNPGSDPRVAYYQDGVYIGRMTAQLGGMFDLAQVQVLKGPQGTLYGRNATAGAVIVTSQSPGAQESGYANLVYGNYNTVNFDGAIGGPIADNLEGRVAVQTKYHDGYGQNITTGAEIDNQDEGSLRGSVRWTPLESLDLLTIFEYHKENDRSGGLHYFGPDNPAIPVTSIALGGQVPSDTRDIASALNPFTEVQTFGATEIATYKFGSATLKSYTSYYDSNATFGTGIDGSSYNLGYATSNEDAHQWSEELQLSGDYDRLHWLTGALYFKELVNDSIGIPVSLATFGGPNILTQGYLVAGRQDNESAAPYVRLSYEFTDKWSLTIGGRYTYERKGINDISQFDISRPYSPSNPVIPIAPFPRHASSDYHQVTPTVTLDYKVDPSVYLYATYTEGFKSGGYNIGIDQSPYQPETVKEYEVGLKSTEFDGKMRVNVDAFYYDYTNLQVTIIVGTNALIENAASAKLSGLDVDFAFLPVSTVQIDGAFEYLHSYYQNYITSNPGYPALGPESLEGHQLEQAPMYTGRIGAQYKWNLPASDDVILRGDYNYSSFEYFTPFNERSVSQKNNSLVNGTLTYNSHKGAWYVGLFVKNLANEKVVAQAYATTNLFGSPVVGVLTPPRTYGLRTGITF